ncbi:unnamed protein product [Ectocarpus sp. 13 AM-2016]
MPLARTLQRWPRGPGNELHKAAHFGSADRTRALLSSGAFDVNQGDPKGFTPLMLASMEGHAHIVKILLDNGANASIVASDRGTALGVAAQNGHAEVAKILVDAGADIEGQTSDGCTPLHVAAYEGHPVVMRVLIEAGANPNSRISDGSTPMYSAAFKGHTEAVRILIRAKANPRFVVTSPSGNSFVPLDMAAQYGHAGVVRELLREHGIRGCAGVTGGVRALRGAAKEQHVGVMAILAEAGVADAGGQALVVAAEFGREASVKFLIGLQEKRREAARVSYVSDTHDPYGRTPVLSGIDVSPERSCSPRIVRMLIDAGAATSGVARITNMLGEVAFNGTPLSITERILRERKMYGQDATVEQLRKLEAVRRLLLQVAAVRAVSWLWPSDCSDTLALPEGKATASKAETPLAMILPALRRRTRKRTALLAPLFRYSSRR